MTRTSPRLVLLAAAASLLLLAGCGTSGGDDAADATTTTAEAATTTADAAEPVDTTETTEAPDTTEVDETTGDDELCGPLKVLSDYDAASSDLINGGGDWSEIQEYFISSTDDVLDAYDEAIALDTDLTDDLQALRDVTETTASTAEASSSLDEFGTQLLDQPGIMEAGEAGFAVNSFAEENCGFSTGGN